MLKFFLWNTYWLCYSRGVAVWLVFNYSLDLYLRALFVFISHIFLVCRKRKRIKCEYVCVCAHVHPPPPHTHKTHTHTHHTQNTHITHIHTHTQAIIILLIYLTIFIAHTTAESVSASFPNYSSKFRLFQNYLFMPAFVSSLFRVCTCVYARVCVSL